MMFVLIFLLVLFALGGGGWGYSRCGFVGGFGTVGVVALLGFFLYLTGNIHP